MKKGLLLLPLLAMSLVGCNTSSNQTDTSTKGEWVNVDKESYYCFQVVVSDYRYTYDLNVNDELKYKYVYKADGLSELDVNYKYDTKTYNDKYVGYISFVLYSSSNY